ncbi:MAG: amino acid permease [Burkholderiales bacterium]|nr:amino acid permease [Burkholderiales bacterium]
MSHSPPSTPDSTPGAPRPVLSTTDAIAIIVGIVIGAGIFGVPSIVAGNVANEQIMLLVWIAGGVISLIGALCYAELATAFPNAGGDYHFLTRAYGAKLSFLFAWARVTVITTASIAAIAFVFGEYVARILPLGELGAPIYAALLVIVLTGINIAGVRRGAVTQNWMTVVLVAGLLLVIVTGLFFVAPAAPSATGTSAAGGGLPWHAGIGLAMVLVLFTYGGWNEAAYISAEVKDGRRNIVRALVYGILVIIALYMLTNAAYLRGLGMDGMARSQAVAADLLALAWGGAGAVLISILVAIAAATSVNATIIAGARSNYALGRDWPLLGFLGRWSARTGTPVNALVAQGCIALGLVLLGALTRNGLQTMVEVTAPVFWFFFMLAGASLIVLRVREPRAERPFRVPLYPVTPIIFCLTSAYLLYSSLAYTGVGAMVGVAVVAVGIVVLAIGLRYGGGPDATRQSA